MLREIKAVKQERGAGPRRWFESDDLDVVVWLSRDAAVIGFQLCYDIGGGEHALTWRETTGFEHSRVDSGDDMRPYKGTPILEPEGGVPWKEVATLFEQRSQTLEVELRRFILSHLAQR